MKLTHKLHLAFAVIMVLALSSAVVAICSTQHIAYLQQRANLSHQVYEGYLSLSLHTYQLFKEHGDRLMSGEGEPSIDAKRIPDLIQADLDAIRAATAREIELVGYEEVHELGRLQNIENAITVLLAEYQSTFEDHGDRSVVENWTLLKGTLDEQFDMKFEELIKAATDDEAAEAALANAESRELAQFHQMLAVLFALIGSAGIALCFTSLARGFKNPIARVLEGTSAFSAGNLLHRIEAEGGPEFAEIADALNNMAEEIAARERALSETNSGLDRAVAERTEELASLLDALQRAEANRRRLLADVSHELRTPLTIIRGEADIALRGAEKPAENYRFALTRTRDMAIHTEQLVDDLLFVARKEAGEVRLNTKRFDLVGLMRNTADSVSTSARENFVSIRQEADMEEATIYGDPGRIRQVIAILLDNALRYGDQEIVMQIEATPSQYILRVSDDGPGMTAEEQASAFERFYRGPNATGSLAHGVGLGLPVAKSIVDAHGGDISIESTLGAGTSVSVTFERHAKLVAVA